MNIEIIVESKLINGLEINLECLIMTFSHGFSVFMPPTSKKLKWHIGLGLSVVLSVHPCVCYTCICLRTVRNRILKFYIWNNHEI